MNKREGSTVKYVEVRRMWSKNHRLRRGILLFAVIGVLGAVSAGYINVRVERTGAKYIVTAEQAPKADTILVLGAYVHPDGKPSAMLHDRLQVALDLYRRQTSDKVLVSGDHGQKNYDEVNAMRTFMEKHDVEPENLFLDHAGFSTYESLYRARDIFKVHKVIIVTQEYHLKRAVYTARQMGMEAYGVAADLQTYRGMPKYATREVAARNKDFMLVHIFKPKPTYLGDEIPISGDGRLTRDQ
ncbi:SanA/YdcF family protein [Paenibacillus sedimenti]|uniref:YdcF family protein n=1 Tax=Paenibacillus sedimenti TaxID=2770274 RepID=A0A926KS37_9BACL|nr:ElyC/SanA/YdcF family protein [Paenibacillus sedimenti]MBD0381179.1 YdcF family protein [Paenibacillus sedimenti]